MTDSQPHLAHSHPASAFPVTYADIVTASARLDGQAHRTPVITSRTVDERTGYRVFFKCENFQRTGSFKFRGAFNAVASLSAIQQEQQKSVLTYSSGNHAQGIALAGQLLGLSTTVIMPLDAPRIKREATQGYGAEIVFYDRSTTTREALIAQMAHQNAIVIPPYDHPAVIAGQGTLAKELFESVGELDALLVCCGGGGLLSGCAIAAHSLSPQCRVIGVEPEQADDATRSFRTKTLQTVHNPETIADGARTPSLGTYTFPLVLHYVHDMVTVSDAALLRTVMFLWERMKLVVEPTGALAAAALLEHIVPLPPQSRVGVVISGGNVDLYHLCTVLSRFSSDEV